MTDREPPLAGFPLASRIVRLEEVKKTTGLSRSTIYSLMQDNKFPDKVPLGDRSIGWLENEVQIWIASRVATRKVAAEVTSLLHAAAPDSPDAPAATDAIKTFE